MADNSRAVSVGRLVLAHPEVKSQGESDAHQLARVCVHPGAPVQGFLQVELDIVEAVADLLAGQVDGRAQVGAVGVKMMLGRPASD